MAEQGKLFTTRAEEFVGRKAGAVREGAERRVAAARETRPVREAEAVAQLTKRGYKKGLEFEGKVQEKARRFGKAVDIESAKAPAKEALGVAEKFGVSIIRTAGLIKHIKGIKTEDQYIKNKEFYGVGGTSPGLDPWPDVSYDMSLYGYGRSTPKGAADVLNALQAGYVVDQLEGVTGLTPVEINASLRYLVKTNRITKEEATRW